MEASMASPARSGAGSRSMADLLIRSAERYGSHPALRHKVGEAWIDLSYADTAAAVQEIGLGLLELGLEPGDRVAILSDTRPEWTLASFAVLRAGGVVVSIYQTNSPEECHYVLEHSEARAVFVEDAEQLAKVREVESRLPHLQHTLVLESAAADEPAVGLEALRERGRAADPAALDERTAAIDPDDACVFIYTSGTTGPPKGCVLSHRNYREVANAVEQNGTLRQGDVVYLFLPLAHAFALLVQFVALDLGGVIAYWERDPQRIVPNLAEVRPTTFPSVPRVFEKIYTTATAKVEQAGGLKKQMFMRSVETGRRVRALEREGREPGPLLRAKHRLADRLVLSRVRALFGGRIREAVTGAAPIAPEILEFFDACGIPVLEGYGMTETSTAATANTLADHRFGSVGRPIPGVEARIAGDGELLLQGPNIFRGYHRDEGATREALIDGWLHTGDLGRIDDEGYVYITGRKKDILITAGGKNITPANIENGLKQSRWISQAVVLGDRRPYLVALITLDEEETPAFAGEHDVAVEEVAGSEAMRDEVQRVVDAVNARIGRVEQVKRFCILRRDLSQEAGELTPTMKVKRGVVAERYAGEVESLYAAPGS